MPTATDADHLPTALSRYPGYLLRFVAERTTARFEDALSGDGLRVRHVEVLAVVDDEGPMSQRRLGTRLRVDKSQMVLLIDELEQLGYAERRRGEHDRRVFDVHLTTPGRRALVRARELGERENDSTFATLDAAETEALHDLLLRVAEAKDRG